MAVREIKKYPDEVLRRQTEPVEDFDEELQKLIEDMVETMYAAPGLGLAANQVAELLNKHFARLGDAIEAQTAEDALFVRLLEPNGYGQDGSLLPHSTV